MSGNPVADSSDQAPGGHIPALDGLRGIAILLVLLYHFTLYGGMEATTSVDRRFYRLAVSGWIGVDLFFVLSGFLITGILYDTKASQHYFRNFYFRRCLRIFPLYYVTLVVFLLVIPRAAAADPHFHALVEQQGWYWGFLVNLKIALAGWSEFGILDHFWSLSVEEQFYLLWPIVVFYLRRRALIGLCLISIVVCCALRTILALAGHSPAAYVLTPARTDTLAVGALLALIARRPDGLLSLKRWIWPVAGIAAVALAAIVAWQRRLAEEDLIVQIIGYPLLAVFFAAILSLALTRQPDSLLGQAFASRGLRFFGRHSYALYVFHHPLVFYLQKQVISVSAMPPVLGLQLPSQLLFILIATSISLAMAVASWHLIEQPFLRLKRLFPYKPDG